VVLSLKVGYLVPGVVVKSMPEHDSHLILISGTELLAFLPKKYANRPYKVGQNLLACVFMLENNRIILSQHCHHYYKRIAERAFSVLIEEEKIKIRRAATVAGAGFAKMAVEGLEGVKEASLTITGTTFGLNQNFADAHESLQVVGLTGAIIGVTVTGSTAVSIKVDAQANRHPISPLIYGVAFASAASDLAGMNCPVHRSGGNSETRYNWQLNAHNHAADWYFESIDDGSATPAATADSFVSTSKSGGAQPMLTIPMIGWPPKLGAARAKLASYSTNKYGPQTGTDWQWMSNAGNGRGTNATMHTSWLITTNDPNDASFPTNSLFQQAFVQHLTNRWGLSTNGGVSCVVGAYGETLDSLPLFTSTAKFIEVPVFRDASPTVYTSWGDWFAHAAMLLSALLSIILIVEEWKAQATARR